VFSSILRTRLSRRAEGEILIKAKRRKRDQVLLPIRVGALMRKFSRDIQSFFTTKVAGTVWVSYRLGDD